MITAGRIESMAAGFARTWQRPPTGEEVKGLADDYVREEIATREAMALGLDRDDTIIRRRLRQKLEFLAEDTIDATPPADAELQAWLDAHAATYRRDPAVSFRQAYFSPDRRRAALDGDVQAALHRLSAVGVDADTAGVGDPLMLPEDVEMSSRTDVARQFGEEFADAVLRTPPGRWTGPIRSGYGLHAVYVRERTEGRAPALAEVRSQVERDFLSDRRRRRLDAMYEGMLARYRVTVEGPQAPRAADASATPGRTQ